MAMLMTLLMDPNNEDVVTFLPDGKYFAIRRKEFSETLLYNHFHLTNFEEFLELIRGWGFGRVNFNAGNEDPTTNGGSNESTASANSGTSSAKAAIHVFRHPHFKRNHPVDMHKLRFGSKKHSHRAVDTARVMGAVPSAATDGGESANHRRTPSQASVIEKCTSEEFHANTSKRRLSPSHVGRDTEDTVMKEQRLHAAVVDGAPPIVPAVSASQDTCDAPQPQPRRSSIELRGAAQAITTSKLQLPNGEAADESEAQSHRAVTGRKPERRCSNASLVDGGVEAATHTIVTDAIETLLFDESHTRETFKKHEKELSISSLPGVVPISKQLFDGSPTPNASMNGRTNAAISAATTTLGSGPGQKQTTKATFSIANGNTNGNSFATSYIGLEAATRNGIQPGAPVRKVTDGNSSEAPPPRPPTSSSAVSTTSPSRLEAAAALVSQSRQGRDAAARAFATTHNGGGVHKSS
ncbi:MAG: hypothetical protein SGILL_001797 [Bacillariaceae sp.]